MTLRNTAQCYYITEKIRTRVVEVKSPSSHSGTWILSGRAKTESLSILVHSLSFCSLQWLSIKVWHL